MARDDQRAWGVRRDRPALVRAGGPLGYRLRRRPPPCAQGRAAFAAARGAWAKAGRAGSPCLAAVAHFALGDAEQGPANVWDYYPITGDKGSQRIAEGMATGPGQVKDTVTAFADIGADERIFLPTGGDPEEITRLAAIVL